MYVPQRVRGSRSITVLTVSLGCACFLVWWLRSELDSLALPKLHLQYQSSDDHGDLTSLSSNWRFDTERDRNDRSLTAEQCDIAFRDAYQEIVRAVEYLTERGGVLQEHIDISFRDQAALRLLISDQQLYIIEAKGATCFRWCRDRIIGVLGQIDRAIITAREPIRDIEFSVIVSDIASMPSGELRALWALARKADDSSGEALWLMPAFNFWSWKGIVGSYLAFQKQVRGYDVQPFLEKTRQAFWRGAMAVSHAYRNQLLAATQGQPWADVSAIDWDKQADLRQKWVSPAEQCSYMFPIYTEGTSWSGRLKYMLNCRSATIIPESRWLTHLHPLLTKNGSEQNHIPIKHDFSDLPNVMNYYLQHPEEAQQVADNAITYFRDRYISPAAETCYWRRLFESWASIAFAPQPYPHNASTTTGMHDSRGISYEEYIMNPVDYPIERNATGDPMKPDCAHCPDARD